MRLLFDLDGTLTNPGVGITRCLQHALAGLGRPVPLAPELAWCVGPPLRESLAQLLDTSDTSLLDQAQRLYRERFTQAGMFENEVYPGVREGLHQLRNAGHILWVVTSKPHVYARQILAHFDLLPLFGAVFGPELSADRADKATLVHQALSTEPSRARSYVIGDRRHDVDGAHANGLAALGVLWGYGTKAELEAAGVDLLFESVSALVAWAAQQSDADA